MQDSYEVEKFVKLSQFLEIEADMFDKLVGHN